MFSFLKKSRKDGEMTFWEHLEVFRKHIVRIAIVIMLFSTLAFIFKSFLFDKIIFAPKEPSFFTNYWLCKLSEYVNISAICINDISLDLINIELAGQFRAHILVAIVSGIILAFPYIIYEILRFIKPALSVKERKGLNSFIFSTTLLFITGVLFGYYIISPLTINFLNKYEVSSQVSDTINLFSYISTVVMLALTTGIVFELPVFIFFLSKIGIITPQKLKKYRKHAIVLFLIISGIITPPDVFSQFLVAIPLYLLYEFSIKISRKVHEKKEALAG